MTIFYNNKTKCKLNVNYKSIHHKYFINFINKKIKFLKTHTSNKIEILKYFYNNNCYHLILKIHNTSDDHHNYLLSKENDMYNIITKHFGTRWIHKINFHRSSTLIDLSGLFQDRVPNNDRPNPSNQVALSR